MLKNIAYVLIREFYIIFPAMTTTHTVQNRKNNDQLDSYSITFE